MMDSTTYCDYTVQSHIHILFVYLSGLQLDAQAAMEYLLNRRDIDTSRIIVFGRSLGGAVAVSLASSNLYSNK